MLTVAAAGRPTVAIHDLTISGGVTTASGRCATICGDGYADATALGGGIAVPPAADGSAGATVTVSDADITANRAEPATTVPSVRSVCPNGPCRFGLAAGGGIDNAGDLTLINTAVTANHAGGALNSDAEGGGILNEEPGTVTLRHTVVAGNEATASAPNGRFAEGGGIFAAGGTLTVDGGAVRQNAAALASALPSDVAQAAIAAGIDVTEGASADIAEASIDANRLSVSNSAGDALAFSAAIHGDGAVVVRRSSISHNSITATTDRLRARRRRRRRAQRRRQRHQRVAPGRQPGHCPRPDRHSRRRGRSARHRRLRGDHRQPQPPPRQHRHRHLADR